MRKTSPHTVCSNDVPTIVARGSATLSGVGTTMLTERDIDSVLAYQVLGSVVDRGGADGASSELALGVVDGAALFNDKVSIGLVFTATKVQVWASNNDASTPTIKWALVGVPV